MAEPTVTIDDEGRLYVCGYPAGQVRGRLAMPLDRAIAAVRAALGADPQPADPPEGQGVGRWCESCGRRATTTCPSGAPYCQPCDDAARRLGYDAAAATVDVDGVDVLVDGARMAYLAPVEFTKAAQRQRDFAAVALRAALAAAGLGEDPSADEDVEP